MLKTFIRLILGIISAVFSIFRWLRRLLLKLIILFVVLAVVILGGYSLSGKACFHFARYKFQREVQGIDEIIDRTTYSDNPSSFPIDAAGFALDLTEDESEFAKILFSEGDTAFAPKDLELISSLIDRNSLAFSDLPQLGNSELCTTPLKPTILGHQKVDPMLEQVSLSRLIYFRGVLALQNQDGPVLLDSLNLLALQAQCLEIHPSIIALLAGVQIERTQLHLLREVIESGVSDDDGFSYDYESLLLKTNLRELLKIELLFQGKLTDSWKKEYLTEEENSNIRIGAHLLFGHTLGGNFKWLGFMAKSYGWKYSKISPYIDKRLDNDGFLAGQHRLVSPNFLETGATIRGTAESRELVRIALQISEKSGSHQKCQIPPPDSSDEPPFLFPGYIKAEESPSLCVITNTEIADYPSVLSEIVPGPISSIRIPLKK